MAEVGGGMTREDSDDLVGSIGQDAVVAVDVREVIVVVEDHAPRHDPRAAGWADRVRRDGHQVQATVDQPLRQHPASTQNFGYRTEARRSEVTVTNPPVEATVTRASLREYAAVQRERYQQASRAEKHRLLDEMVAVTGLHQMAEIRLLRQVT